MIKVLIVDDEVIIRNGLSTVINWAELDFHLLPPAESAEEALERIPGEKPHIVLTDIRMTGKDGLMLAAELKEMLPDTEVIILTGYDDFGYAQQALREGVSDYLLKTSRPEEIIKAAIKARQRIESRWESQKQDHVKQSAYRDKLLDRLLVEGSLDRAGVEQVGQLLTAACADARTYRAMIVAASGWGDGAQSVALLHYSVQNIAAELLPCVTVLRPDCVVLLLCDGGEAADASLQKAQIELGRIGRKLKCKLFAAAGSPVRDVEALKRSYEEALYASTFRWMSGEDAVVEYERVKARQGGNTVCAQEVETRMIAILKQGSVIELRHWVQETMTALMQVPDATPQSVDLYMNSVILSARRWLERAWQALGQPGSPPYASGGLSEERNDKPEEALFARLKSYMDLYRESMSGERVSYIQRAVAYIRDNLDRNLTLQHVANHIHLNPNHFSEVFKREIGMTYIEYVTNERIRRAMEMLDESSIKINEVAGRVGYEDVKYFSQLFKKITGKTPSEYRLRN
ncbi:response regulator [Cohnella sp. GCM10027633]|uniref:response regulator n=1 Tax=unclassified Cohnella TaxID=2636738 RepID=UPI003644A4BE